MIVCVPVIVCVTFSIKTKSITHNSSPSSASRSDPGQKMSDAHKELVMKKSLFNFLNSIPGAKRQNRYPFVPFVVVFPTKLLAPFQDLT